MWTKTQLLLVATLVVIVGGSAAQKKGVASTIFGKRIVQSPRRNGKSLVNTFPFNRRNSKQSAADHGHHHHHHDHNNHQQQALSSRSSRQGTASNEVPLDIGSIAAAGERCIDKVVMTEQTEYDDQITCKHSYTERCHVTYKTDYEPQQEEECNENYRKKCYIEYKNTASQEKVQFCFTPLVRNCDLPGPTECTTEYRSECTTRYHEHEVEEDRPVCQEEQEEKCETKTQGYSTTEECTKWPVMKCSLETKVVKKYTPETDCKKVPYELCGPSGCPVEAGPEQCFDKSETVVQEVPEETCSLEPQKECKQVTKLVPLLKPAEECVDIPKEVCVRSRTNPRRVQKPIIKKWCYTPSEESGLPPPPPRPTTRPPPRPTRPPPRPTRPPPTRRPSGNIPNNNNNQGRQTPRPFQPPPPVGCNPAYDANYCPARAGDRVCNPECNTPACNYDGGDCRPTEPPSCVRGYPASHCPSRAANGVCDPECDTNACGNDGGDCVPAAPPNSYLPPPGQASYQG